MVIHQKNLMKRKRTRVLKSNLKIIILIMLLPALLQADYPRRSVQLNRITSGFLPPGGLLSIDLKHDYYNTSYGLKLL